MTDKPLREAVYYVFHKPAAALQNVAAFSFTSSLVHSFPQSFTHELFQPLSTRTGNNHAIRLRSKVKGELRLIHHAE